MRKDYRIKIPYDLQRAFGDYHQPQNLKHYFRLYSADDNSIDSSLSNIAEPIGYPIVGSDISTLRTSPFNKLVRYTSDIKATDGSYYRVAWGGTNYNAFRNDGNTFTIGMWVQIPVIGTGSPDNEHVIFNKVKAGTLAGNWGQGGIEESQNLGEMAITYISAGNNFKFQWVGKNLADNNYYIINVPTFDLNLLDNGPYRSGDWIYLAVTMSHSLPVSANTLIESIVTFYVNGKDATDKSSITGGDAVGGIKISPDFQAAQNYGDILIGRGLGDTNPPSSNDNTACRVYDLAIWDAALEQPAIASIWERSKFFEGTGFLSLPPRVQLKKEVSTTPVYFASKNTPIVQGQDRLKGFDDSRTITFETERKVNLQYPLGIPYDGGSLGTGSYDPNDLTSCLLATPNKLPDIWAPGIKNFGILQNYYGPSQISEGQPRFLPFNDALVLPNGDGNFYGGTTSIGGFNSKLRDKIQVTIELPMNETATVSRYSAKWDAIGPTTPNLVEDLKPNDPTAINPHYDAEGEFKEQNLTGFLYYNKSRGAWEQKGIADVVTGQYVKAIGYIKGDQNIEANGVTFTLINADNIPQVFIFDTSVTTCDGTWDAPGTKRVLVGLSGLAAVDVDKAASRMASAINGAGVVEASGDLGWSATSGEFTAKSTVTIIQSGPGKVGNTVISQTGGMTLTNFSGGSTGYSYDEIAQELKASNLTFAQDSTRRIVGSNLITSGVSHVMRLFYPGGCTDGQGQYAAGGLEGNGVDVGVFDTQLAANVGHPMCTNYGPNAYQYFATGSQVLKMKDYISEPFLLEKVILEIPDTVARKIYDFEEELDSPTAARPQDDYVFFLMRQARRYPGMPAQFYGPNGQPLSSDSEKDKIRFEVSSSVRYLICSGNACFYNDERRVPGKIPYDEEENPTFSPWEPRNSPAFVHNFSSSIGTAHQHVMVRSGSIMLPMIPAVPSRKMLGNYILPTWDGSSALYITQSGGDVTLFLTGSTVAGDQGACYPGTVQAFWPGGTSTLPLSGALSGSRSDVVTANLHSAKEDTTDPYGYLRNTVGEATYNERTFYEINSYVDPGFSKLSAQAIDSRTFKFFGAGGSKKGLNVATVSGLSGSWQAGFPDDLSDLDADSPYLLFPEDELVLGLDAALGWTATMASGITAKALKSDNMSYVDPKLIVGANNLTGSLLRLERGQPMTLRLYGSLVKDQVEAPSYPKSDITQPDITDVIIGSHTLDEYDISSLMENSGSYRERLFTGSLTNPPTGPSRVENKGEGIYSSAVNASPFYWSGNSIAWQQGAGAHVEVMRPDWSTVITCSIPSSLTGFTYDSTHPTPGAPLDKIYIRFWPNLGGIPNPPAPGPLGIYYNFYTVQNWDHITDGGGGPYQIRPDEIFIWQPSKTDMPPWDAYSGIPEVYFSHFISYLINGAGYSWGMNYYIKYGTSVGGVYGGGLRLLGILDSGPLLAAVDGNQYSPYDGIPGLSATYSEYGKVTISVTGDPVDGNKVNFIEGRVDDTYNNSSTRVTPGIVAAAEVTGSQGTPTADYPALFTAIDGGAQSLGGGLVELNAVREVAATTSRGNMGEYGSFNRFLTFPCSTEKYFDTAVPFLEEIWACLDRKPLKFDILDISGTGIPGGYDKFELLIYGITVGKYALGTGPGGDGTGLSDIGSQDPFSADWWAGFPFEPRYAVRKNDQGMSQSTRRTFGSQAVTDSEGRIAAALYWITNDTYAGWGQGYTHTGSIQPAAVSGSFGWDFQDLVGGPGTTIGKKTSTWGNAQIGLVATMDEQTFGLNPSYSDLAKSSLKVFYGAGDGLGSLVTNSPEDYLYPTSEQYAGIDGKADSNGYYPNYYKIFRRSRKPRGWKYGLLNALPQYTNITFRSDHYGQFRDMLEIRPYGVFTWANSSLENNYDLGPVVVGFQEPMFLQSNPGIIVTKDPVSTRSGNLSMFATSSLPFFDECDGVYGKYPFGRDRPEEIKTEEFEIYVETT
jgi:hypothetical protein